MARLHVDIDPNTDLEQISLKIINWAKFNPRKDIKNPNWFALSNRILEDPKLFDLTPIQFKSLIYLFCQASQSGGNDVVTLIYFNHALHVCNVEKHELIETINKLIRINVVELVGVVSRSRTRTSRGRHADVSRTCPDTTEQDTTEQNKTEQDTTEQNASVDVRNKTFSARVATASPRGCIHEFGDNPVVVERMREVTERAQRGWLEAYPDVHWVTQEILRAHAWCETNPKKAPKNFGPFMGNWLSRGYENYRKGLSTRRLTSSEVNAEAAKDMYLKIQRGDV